ncbi:MAG: ABC transporter permease [Alphaproteobacteria bacterium]|nr:ABC transporter permease [Alphaproteobacteria bacterium]
MANLPIKYSTRRLIVGYSRNMIMRARRHSIAFMRYLCITLPKRLVIYIISYGKKVILNRLKKITKSDGNHLINWQTIFTILWALFLVILLVIIPLIDLHDPLLQYPYQQNLAPHLINNGHESFLLGTDELGRDRLSRLIHAMRYSLMIASIATIIAFIIGSILGVIAGLNSRFIGKILDYCHNIIAILPMVILVIAWAVTKNATMVSVIAAIVFVEWHRYYAVIRNTITEQINMPYVVYGRLFSGDNQWQLVYHEMFPNCKAALYRAFFSGLNVALLLEIMVGFLLPLSTLSGQEGVLSWGKLLQENLAISTDYYWLATLPFIMLLLTMIMVRQLGKICEQRWRHG